MPQELTVMTDIMPQYHEYMVNAARVDCYDRHYAAISGLMPQELTVMTDIMPQYHEYIVASDQRQRGFDNHSGETRHIVVLAILTSLTSLSKS